MARCAGADPGAFLSVGRLLSGVRRVLAPPRLTAGAPSERRLVGFSIALGLFLLVLDQWTKILVEQRMTPGDSIELIPGWFSLTYVTNKGAAWGMFHGYGMVLFGIGVVVLILAIRYLRYLAEGCRERYMAIFIVLSGVIGNSFDRLYRGAVVDFLDFYWRGHHWPAFNIADCAICFGIGVYFLSVVFRGKENDGRDRA